MKSHARWVWLVALCLIGISPLRAEKVDDAWLKKVAALPAEKQVEAVVKKLKQLNPDFDGKATPKIEKGVVTGFDLETVAVTDISPIKALSKLKILNCTSESLKGKLADLSPLRGMRLKALNCDGTQVSDLTPLKGMPLTKFNCNFTKVLDLCAPQRDAPDEPGL